MSHAEFGFCGRCRRKYAMQVGACPYHFERLVPDALLGTVVDGRYVVERCIGSGGLGRVYRVRNPRVARAFAMKVADGDAAHFEEASRRLQVEAFALMRLRHPGIVSIYDVGATATGAPFVVMDLIEGESLTTRLHTWSPTPREAFSLIRQVAIALEYAHSRGLVHRDLKPDNILLARDGGPRIIDFGLAFATAAPPSAPRLTAKGLTIGTLGYMAPEQAMGHLVDGRADVYSLGLITYRLLAGVAPYDGKALEVARRLLREDAPPLSARAPWLGSDYDAAMARLIARKVTDRVATATEMIAVLDELIALADGSLHRAALAWFDEHDDEPTQLLAAGI